MVINHEGEDTRSGSGRMLGGQWQPVAPENDCQVISGALIERLLLEIQGVATRRSGLATRDRPGCDGSDVLLPTAWCRPNAAPFPPSASASRGDTVCASSRSNSR